MAGFMGGYMGKVLHVDLETGEVRQESLDPEMASRFIGGMGLSTKVLYDEVGPEVDPLGPENVMIFATGPLTGTNAPASGRLEVTAKSPANGALGTGNTGGIWGVELKRAGYDVLIVRRSSPEPVYLWIDDGHVEIRKAGHLWGRDAWETTEMLGEELGARRENEIKVMTIGPAGENLVRFASLINEYYHSAARSGLGAVMGSKKLKAIAVRGSGRVTVARPEAFQAARREAMDRIVNSWHPAMKDTYKDFGDVGPLRLAKGSYRQGSLPFNNFQTTVQPQWMETNTMEMARPHIKGKKGVCYACPLACFNLAEVDEGKYAGLKIANATFVGPVFEFGGKCAIMSMPAIWKCKEVCHKLGMDIFSAGPIIAFAMELYQRGIIGKEDTGGLALEWGDEEAALQLLEDMAYRRGLGDILAEGSLGAAERLGKGARDYAYTTKGLEMFGTDPRASGTTWILGYLDSPRGGDNVKTTHTHADHAPLPRTLEQRFQMSYEDYCRQYIGYLDIFDDEKKQIFGDPPRLEDESWEGKAALTKWMGDLCSAISTLVLCIFPTTFGNALGPTHYARMLSAVTGEETTARELMEAGERVFNLQRLYLTRGGMDSKDDDFPDKFYDEEIPDGPAKGARLSRETIHGVMQEYYQLRGWDQNGVPTREKLAQLGLP